MNLVLTPSFNNDEFNNEVPQPQGGVDSDLALPYQSQSASIVRVHDAAVHKFFTTSNSQQVQSLALIGSHGTCLCCSSLGLMATAYERDQTVGQLAATSGTWPLAAATGSPDNLPGISSIFAKGWLLLLLLDSDSLTVAVVAAAVFHHRQQVAIAKPSSNRQL
eukprot:TRINITY_DN4511_c1_g2_i1.p1 TRINITY_DN4511_c1_g2~~TRINITY_DN4511_c1_g2_i1.p1  ORF type:complete len:163 (-),score=29.95 TRINITY_DN4511_c1_g2_i1:1621-2109(-)